MSDQSATKFVKRSFLYSTFGFPFFKSNMVIIPPYILYYKSFTFISTILYDVRSTIRKPRYIHNIAEQF